MTEQIKLKDGNSLIREYNSQNCLIWETPALVYRFSSRPNIYLFRSDRAGGDYICECVTGKTFKHNTYKDTVEAKIRFKNGTFKAKLTSCLIDQRKQSRWNDKKVPFLFDEDPFQCELSTDDLLKSVPQITKEILQEIEDRQELSIDDRTNNLLQYLNKINKMDISEHRIILSEEQKKMKLLAHSECTSDQDWEKFSEYLIEEKLCSGYVNDLQITINGIKRLESLSRNTESKQCFVAMWLDESMNDMYNKAIKPAIKEMGYRPLRIDRKPHINKIDDELIEEIKKSRFIIADFSYGNDGIRGSVYYEAGFAKGLNIPIIFTCRKEDVKNLHFDTRQYNHIIWENKNLEDLKKKLKDSIGANID